MSKDLFQWPSAQELAKKMKSVSDALESLAIPSLPVPKHFNLKAALDNLSQKPMLVLENSKVVSRFCQPPRKGLRMRAVNNRQDSELPETTMAEGLSFEECVEAALKMRMERMELLYRASESGYDSKAFKAACRGEPDTLVLIRSNKDRIFGGYSPCPWPAADEFGNDEQLRSFVFAIDREQACFSKFEIRAALHKYAISSYTTWGPIFGSPYGPDIAISNKCDEMRSHSSMGSYYHLPDRLEEHSPEAKELLCGEEKFIVLEYEVYRLHLRP